MPKLTLSNCKAAVYKKESKNWCISWDDEIKGFGLRVYPSGKKSFILHYRHAGKTRLYTIGNYGTWTPEQARKEARRLIVEEIDKGRDPRQLRRAGAIKKPTFSELREMYIAKQIPKKRSRRCDISMLKLYIPPSWDTYELEKFTRIEMARIHQKIGNDKGHISANRFISMLRRMFNLAIDWGLLKEGHPNPCSKIDRFPEKKRERFVRPDELPKLWEAIEKESDPYWQAFFYLSLLVGTRRSELLSMRWENVDLKNSVWYIPEEDTKPGRAHYIPLPKVAEEILERLPKLIENPWVFPSRSGTITGHLTEPKRAWKRVCERAGLSGIKIHDLRRTVGSWLAAQGESLVMIGKVLNHSQPATTAIYARLHLEPVRAALEKNAEKMMEIVSKAGDKS